MKITFVSIIFLIINTNYLFSDSVRDFNINGFKLGDSDYHYETFSRVARDLKLGHHSVNFDRGGFAADINVVYPIDRLEELLEEGVIGDVASNHYSFAGNQPATLSEIRLDSGPSCAREMIKEDVDIVLLTNDKFFERFGVFV